MSLFLDYLRIIHFPHFSETPPGDPGNLRIIQDDPGMAEGGYQEKEESENTAWHCSWQ